MRRLALLALLPFLERRLSFSDSVDAVEILPIDDANESRAYKVMILPIYITRTFTLRSLSTLKGSVLVAYYCFYSTTRSAKLIILARNLVSTNIDSRSIIKRRIIKRLPSSFSPVPSKNVTISPKSSTLF